MIARPVRVLGLYGHHNSGDDAFRDVHRTIGPQLDWRWLSPGRFGESATPPDERVVVLSAGDIVSEFYTQHLPPAVSVLAYGVGLAGHLQMDVLRALGSRLRGVWVRNETDVALLRDAGLPAQATPDIVFCLHGHLPANRLLPDKPRKRAIVVVSDNVRADVLRANDTRRFIAFQHFLDELAEAIAYLADWYQVVLVPFSYDHNDYDLAAIFDLRPRLRARDALLVLEDRPPPLEMMALFETADLVVTQKFHGAVYAMLHGTPFLAISDARKGRTALHRERPRPAAHDVAQFQRAGLQASLAGRRGARGGGGGRARRAGAARPCRGRPLPGCPARCPRWLRSRQSRRSH